MKTVMKKMFCLMLVAVLMVGVMPFQAFAAGYNVGIHVYVDGQPVATTSAPANDDNSMPLSTWQGVAEAALPAGTEATFSGWSWAGGDGFDPSTKIGGESWVIVANFVENTCTGGCGKKVSKCICCDSCSGTTEAHASDCPTLPCGITGCTYGNGHEGEHSVGCDVTGCTGKLGHAGGHVIPCDITGCTLGNGHSGEHTVACDTEGCTKKLGHEGSHNIPCLTSGCTKQRGHTDEHTVACTTANCALKLGHSGEHKCSCGLFLQAGTQHNTGCPYKEAAVNNYSLNVWAKLWVGETLQKTILLDTITGLNGSDVVPYVIGNNVARLESKFPAGYKNIEWTKAVYYMIDSTKSGTVDTNMNVNEEDNVYINLYSQEKLVVVRVHTSKVYGVDRSVQVGGFRPGDVVTYDDVLKAVSKHYNVSSMKMYTYGEWEKVVAGGSGSTIPNFVVQGGDSDNVYEVYVTGSYKTTSTGTTYKADSTNPKTGDMIFAPVMVLGLSASALAVLFYLNKKRAF